MEVREKIMEIKNREAAMKAANIVRTLWKLRANSGSTRSHSTNLMRLSSTKSMVRAAAAIVIASKTDSGLHGKDEKTIVSKLVESEPTKSTIAV